ncbi:hypothetical protein IGI04_023187, partial [Brassica rapa subsp. trilocularis]
MQPEDPYGGPLGQDPVYLYNKTRGKAMQEFRERIQPTMAGPTWDSHKDFCTKQQQFLTAIVGTTQDSTRIKSSVGTTRRRHFRERIQPTMAGPTWDPHEDFCTKQQQFLTAIVGTTQDSTRIKSSVGTTRRRHVFQAASPEKAVRPLVNLSCVQLESPMTASDYIKNQPHLQGRTLTPNPYSALAEYPPLSYSKAVSEKSSKMEAQSSTATPNTTSNTTPNTKQVYYTKPYKQHLMTTPYTKPVNLTQLKTFINRVFYEDSPWPTDNITKNQSFYEYILVDSKSIEITHYKDKTNPNLINYSTCKFLRICSTQDLGFIHHHTTKPFSTPGYHIDGYTYTDYKNAFFRAFLLRPYDHSWFFSFDQNCTKTIPGWFNEWWYWYGPADPIYPDQVLKTSYPFYKKHVFDQPVGPLNKIWFHIDMGIPWICSWHFTLAIALQDMPYSLLREFRVKWWEKYNLDRCSLAGIQKYFQITNQAKTAIQTISKSIPLLNPTQISQTNPSPQKRPTSSPTSSTTSSSSQKSSRKEKMKKLIAEMLTQFEAEHDDTDDDNQQVDIMQPEDPYGGPLGQDPVYLYNKTRGKAMQEFRERIQPTMAGPTWDSHKDFCTKQQQFLTAIVGTTQDSTRIKSSVGTTRRRHVFQAASPEKAVRPLVNLSCVQLESLTVGHAMSSGGGGFWAVPARQDFGQVWSFAAGATPEMLFTQQQQAATLFVRQQQQQQASAAVAAMGEASAARVGNYLPGHHLNLLASLSGGSPGSDDKGETTILAVHSKDTPTTTYTPKQLKWDEITIPDQWKIEITQPPRNFEQKNISKIIEQKDGKILLRFGSYRDPLPPRISLYHSRASFSEYRTGQSSTNSETESVNQNTKQDELIRFKAPIAEPDQDAYPTSPTPSDFRSINVITKKYEIDKQYIREDFYSKENEEKRIYLYNKTRGKAMQEFRERIQPTMAGPTWDSHKDFCTKQQQFLTAIVGTTQDSTRIKSSVGTTRRRHVFQAASPEKAVRPLVNLSCVQLESQSTSEFNPRCLLQDDKGETTILAVHSKDTPTATYTPKQLKWDEITIPDQWKIEITQPPRNFEQKNISKIIEQKDGKILLRFGSYRDPLPPRISSYHSRASFSEYRTGQSSTNSETESVNQNTKQDEPIRFKAPIAEPDQDAYPTSPTPSDFRSINVITKKYEIDKQYIREDFYSKENEEKR